MASSAVHAAAALVRRRAESLEDDEEGEEDDVEYIDFHQTTAALVAPAPTPEPDGMVFSEPGAIPLP